MSRSGLEWRRPDEFPAMAPAHVGRFTLVHRREGAIRPLLLLEQTTCAGWSIEKQYPPGVRAGVFPGMRYPAWHEGAGAGAADREFVADFERDLAAQDIGHLVAVVVQMERALRSCGNGLLEQHDAVAGRSTQQLEDRRPTRRHVQYR